jgi:hypothetical protein
VLGSAVDLPEQTPLFVVLGHDGCGGVTAALDSKLHDVQHQSRIRMLVENILPGLSGFADTAIEGQLAQAVEANVRWSMRQLAESPEGACALEESRAKLVGAVYEISSGCVRFLDCVLPASGSYMLRLRSPADLTNRLIVATGVRQPSISDRKLAANRQNAQRSTGPRTERGKRNSRRNALKHGVLVSKLLVMDGLGTEDAVAFQRLLSALRRDCPPEGELEEILVEKIAICVWRQRRALHCEAGIIRRAYVPDKHDPDKYLNDRLAAIKDHLSLPSGRDMDRILRYEASIQRQLALAINQLERLQRARKGEHGPRQSPCRFRQ